MQCQNPSIRLMNSVSSDKGIAYVPVHVEVNTVSADDVGLTALGKFSVGDSADETVLGWTVHHEMGTV